jgi:hypothetical protein
MSDGASSVIRACANDSVCAVSELLDRGRDVEETNEYGQTPLVVAVQRDRADVIGLLLARGADQHYVLQHLMSTGQQGALNILCEYCDPALKAPFLPDVVGTPLTPPWRLRRLVRGLQEDRHRLAVAGRQLQPESEARSIRLGLGLAETAGGGSPSKAVRRLNRFVRAYPFRDLHHRLLGEALMRAGEFATAREVLEVALTIRQTDLETHQLLRQAIDAATPGTARPNDLSQAFCPLPFERLVTSGDGRAYVCCPSWLPRSLGGLEGRSWESIWYSSEAQDIRRSILSGDFRHCSRINCPFIAAGSLPLRRDITDAHLRSMIAGMSLDRLRPPREFVFGHDLSCNLACPSCRREVFVEKQESALSVWIREQLLRPLLPHLRRLEISGSGELLASKPAMLALDEVRRAGRPGPQVVLLSNGTLLNPIAWNKLSDRCGRISEIHVSIDGASKEVYESLRRGACYEETWANMTMLADLRKQGVISHLRVVCVVQRRNFHEIPALIHCCRRWGVDKLVLSRITSWGTYAPAEFIQQDVASPLAGEHGAFLKVLAHEALQDPMVDAYNLYDCFRLAVASEA